MSVLTQTKRAAPSVPATGKASQFIDAAGRQHVLDATGVDNVLNSREMYNYVRNGGFWFAQRQPPGTATGYTNTGGRIITADGWGISNENSATQYRRVDTSGAFETGLQGRFWGEFLKATTLGKIIVTQVIEGSNAQLFRGRTVRVQFWAKSVVAASLTLKIGLLNWTGTVDAVPSAAGLLFSAHGANGVDPTLTNAGSAYLPPKTGVIPDNATAATNNATCTATTTWQRFGAVFDVPTTARNLVLMIHSDNQIAATNGFGIAQVSLTDGFEIQDWSPQGIQEELNRVLRYYCKTFAADAAPVQNAGVTTGCLRDMLGKAVATAVAAQFQWRYPVQMRAAPTTITTYNPGAANAQVRQIGGTAADLTATATANPTDVSVDVTATGAAGGAVGDQVGIHITADAEL